MTTKIKDRYFKYGSHKYFRVSAHEVNLCSYGQKRVPLGRTGYLDVSGRVNPRHLADEPIKVNVIDIDWDRVTNTDIGVTGGLTYQGVGVNASHAFSLNRARDAQLKLVSFSIDENPLERVLNREANYLRRQMEEEGNDARIVSKIWVAMEARLADDLTVSTLSAADLDYAGSSLKVNIGTKVRNRSVVTLAPGTTFAYRLSRIRRWNGNRTRVEDLSHDYVD